MSDPAIATAGTLYAWPSRKDGSDYHAHLLRPDRSRSWCGARAGGNWIHADAGDVDQSMRCPRCVAAVDNGTAELIDAETERFGPSDLELATLKATLKHAESSAMWTARSYRAGRTPKSRFDTALRSLEDAQAAFYSAVLAVGDGAEVLAA